MLVNTKDLISLTEANQNFSKVARTVDEKGSVIILKNNAPRYIMIDFKKLEQLGISVNESLESLASQILQDNLEALRLSCNICEAKDSKLTLKHLGNLPNDKT